MKLIIQIPCKDEEKTLPLVLKELPDKLPGIDKIEYQVIDDGSTDGTYAIAKKLGVHHIIRFKKNKGLGVAFREGLKNALKNGADILVNTDADNQYPSKYIKDLIGPLLKGEADIVIGNRRPTEIVHFSSIKRFLQKIGNKIVSYITGEALPDAVSGFRAYSREAMIELNITTKFSYVLDTIIQAYKKELTIAWVPIVVNKPTRPSRLFSSTFKYLKRTSIDILRIYTVYEPLKVLFFLSFPFIVIGLFGIARFLYFYFVVGEHGGKLQSLIISGIIIQIGFTFFSLGIIGDLISKNRFLIEESLKMQKKDKYR